MRYRGALAVSAALAAGGVACEQVLGLSGFDYADGGSLDARGHTDAGGGFDAGDGANERGRMDVGARVDAEGGSTVDAALCSAPPDTTADCGSGLVRCLPSGICGINPENDKINCGECGRVCDGNCVGGTCLPTMIDTGGWPGSRVAWAGHEGVIWITGKKGSEQAFIELVDGGVQAVSGTDDVMADLAVEGTTDYVLENYEIDVNSILDGTNINVLSPGYNLGPDGRIAYDATRLYYTEGHDDAGVGAIDKDGGGYVALATSQSHPSDVFLADAGVVFLNRATAGANNGAILVIDPGMPGSTSTRVNNLGPISELVSTNDGSAFYAFVRKGEIWHLDTGTFETDRIATWARVDHVAGDATYVVFAGQPTSASPLGIYRMPRCGGPALPVMTDSTIGVTTGLKLYGPHVYWSASGGLYRTTR